MTLKKDISSRIKELREQKNLSQPIFGDAIGFSGAVIQGVELGRTKPSAEMVAAVTRTFGVSGDWLLTGEGPMRQENGTALPSDEFALIPRYDVEAAAGEGSLVNGEAIIDRMAFRRDWLVGEMGLELGRLGMIKVDGDSMEPALRSGELILLDMRESGRIRSDAIYVIRMDGHLLVKRVQRLMDGGIEVFSDNPAYRTFQLTPEEAEEMQVKVVGRVVWAGRRM